MHRILIITVIGAGLFVFVPSAIFMQIEQWTYWEAAYYCAITLISIGFGDFVPGYGDGKHHQQQLVLTLNRNEQSCQECYFYLVVNSSLLLSSFYCIL